MEKRLYCEKVEDVLNMHFVVGFVCSQDFCPWVTKEVALPVTTEPLAVFLKS